MPITITWPQAFNSITHVKCQGTGQVGSICACGNASAFGAINGVWAKAVAIGTVLPTHHPSGAQPGSFDAVSGDWWFLGTQLVPGVPCVANPGDNTYLFAVWCSFQGGTRDQHQSRRFAAKCATATDCDGTASPCAGITRRHPNAVADAGAGTGTSTVSIAPRQYQVQYQVKGQGVRGPLASVVNTTWALSLRTGGCGCTFAWDNEGDGIQMPRVVLRPDGVISTEWNVTLVLNGRRAHYTCPTQEWNALGVNRVRRVSGDESLPETLIVKPL
jgi:hypothetical protein